MALCNERPSVFAQLAGERFVAKQLLDTPSKFGAIHPWHKPAVVTVNQPFTNATSVEGDHGQTVAHGFNSDRAEGLRPDRTHDRHAGFPAELVEFPRQGIAFEMDAFSQPEPAAQFFAEGTVVAVIETAGAAAATKSEAPKPDEARSSDGSIWRSAFAIGRIM